jgi:hypothetical protein
MDYYKKHKSLKLLIYYTYHTYYTYHVLMLQLLLFLILSTPSIKRWILGLNLVLNDLHYIYYSPNQAFDLFRLLCAIISLTFFFYFLFSIFYFLFSIFHF